MDTIIKLAIIDGPNADRLIDAFKYAYDDASNISIVFKAKKSAELFVWTAFVSKIVGVTHKDGTGHSFEITGYCKVPRRYLEGKPIANVQDKELLVMRFEAFYDAKNRCGSLNLY